ncbi:nose resistant to fluoxetine protein 6-like [Anopheles albimanus]|uniref:nose resistant to fluoxetine protein 6-like n=1 Tax=Anopheles albimanus TaxID=7167 RepID=UPI0016407F7E|nr:nose resistant to fluoxetine protein 6-like [Anopheles albimanus]
MVRVTICWLVGLLVVAEPIVRGQQTTTFDVPSALASIVGGLQLRNDTLCDIQLAALRAGLQAKELWSLEFGDAWGKWPAGVLAGNFYELGHYDQCVGLRHTPSSPQVGTIEGRYCLLTVPLDRILPKPQLHQQQQRIMPGTSAGVWAVHLGACLPTTCTAEHILQRLTTSNPALPLPVSGLVCNSTVPPLGTPQFITIGLFAGIGLLVLASTVYDVLVRWAGLLPASTVLTICSLYTNVRKLLATSGPRPDHNSTNKSSTINCIHGIRVLSMVWVVFSHNYVRIGMIPLLNSPVILTWLRSYHSMVVVASTVSVDTFFLLSGLLTCWSILNALDRQGGRLNLPMMYAHRYLRLTPALAALVLYTTALMRHSGSGPFWDGAMTLMADNCRDYWWSTLLYVQNYVNPGELCLGHSWYLSVDMQLYLIAPFLVYPLWRWGRRVLLPLAALLLTSMVTVFVLFIVYDLRLSFLAVDGERIRHRYTYYPTHTRMGAWLVGLGYGYALQRTRKRRVRLAPWLVAASWFAAAATMLAILLTAYPLHQPDYAQLPVVADATYEALNRVAWATAIGWIIFACVNGYGGAIDRFLGAPLWQPLGRLSYSVYLLHLPIQLMMAGSIRQPYYFTDLLATYQFWGDLGFTCTLAILWVLLFESPIIGLERILFRSGRNDRDGDGNGDGDNRADGRQRVASMGVNSVAAASLPPITGKEQMQHSLALQTARL